jgi:hypothetical protein
MYGVFNVLFGLMASAIAVTAFRAVSGWAWWALLVGNTIALVAAMTIRPNRQRHWPVRVDGIPWPRARLVCPRDHSTLPRSAAVGSNDRLEYGPEAAAASRQGLTSARRQPQYLRRVMTGIVAHW